jgi:hypothetical protein
VEAVPAPSRTMSNTAPNKEVSSDTKASEYRGWAGCAIVRCTRDGQQCGTRTWRARLRMASNKTASSKVVSAFGVRAADGQHPGREASVRGWHVKLLAVG